MMYDSIIRLYNFSFIHLHISLVAISSKIKERGIYNVLSSQSQVAEHVGDGRRMGANPPDRVVLEKGEMV